MQRSVFQGELSAAQYRALVSALKENIDTDYDTILTYVTRSPDMVETGRIGIELGNSEAIL